MQEITAHSGSAAEGSGTTPPPPQPQSGAVSGVFREGSPPDPSADIWIYAVTFDIEVHALIHERGPESMVDLVVDSGSAAHCCSPGCFPGTKLKQTSTPWRLHSATGARIGHYGSKSVVLRQGVVPFRVTFQVADVTRPILSVSALLAQGLVAHLGRDMYLQMAMGTGPRLELMQDKGLFLLRAAVCGQGGPHAEKAPPGLLCAALGDQGFHSSPPQDDVWDSGGATGSGEPPAQEEKAAGQDHDGPTDLALYEESGANKEDPAASTLAHAAAPSEAEQAHHRLTHLPFAAWCESCVRGRAREDAHRRRQPIDEVERGPPVVQFDYCFLK